MYNIPVLGLEDGHFDAIQILALFCILISLSCAITVLISLFKGQKCGTFFTKRTKCERFTVYVAICDGLFNISHFADHLHMYLARDHVRPIQLCAFYGFIVFEFITTQYFIVVVISINAFVLVRFNRQFGFGKWDWRFLVSCFGTSFLVCLVAALLREMGPTGAFCGIHGRTANLFFSTIPQCAVIIVISILYTLTWCHIRKAAVVKSSGSDDTRKSTRAAKTMTLFVVVFVIQYWASGMYAVWQTVAEPPIELMYPVIAFTNIGGLLNGVVYITRIRKNGHSTRRIQPQRKVFMTDKI